ncbi:MAG TPA: D-aminoacylase [Sedimentisphaerales bacterium]|nr:D-aminoacylase [Sedimentisphaerales bacterium]
MKSITRREFIKKSAITGITLGAISTKSALGIDSIKSVDSEFDIIIKGGNIIDGTGKEAFCGDVCIKGERIVEIGKNIAASAGKKIIDASGLTVCPGFIDVHTHSAGGSMSYGYIHQGVTTEIGGNCGSTGSPKKTQDGKHTIGQDLEAYEKQKSLTNFGTLVGHAAIRNFGMGLEDRDPTSAEITVMQGEVAESLEQGVFGLSSGLEYTPGCFSKANEMIELCKIVKKYDAIYTTHMRNESDKVLDSILETIQVGKAADVRVEISHLKLSRVKAWHLADKVLETIEKARKEGLDIACDKYPYAAWSTYLAILFPDWAKAGDSVLLGQCSNLIGRLKDASLDAKLRSDVEKVIEDMAGPENLLIDGKTLKELSQELNQTPYDVMKDLIIKTNGTTGVIGFSMNEKNIEKLLAFPLTSVASDGYGHGFDGRDHPRSFGTFARVLGRYIRERKIMSLQEGIRKMTSWPAEHFQIKDRGVLEKGKFADVTIFDQENIIDTATFENPTQKPKGIEYVIVNGNVTIEKGQLTETRAGKVLRRV